MVSNAKKNKSYLQDKGNVNELKRMKTRGKKEEEEVNQLRDEKSIKVQAACILIWSNTVLVIFN
jgi:hypothetical protein